MTPEERAEQQAVALAKRRAEIETDIKWWRKQEKIRVEGFNITQTDPMYVKMNERYEERKRTEEIEHLIRDFVFDEDIK